MCGIIGYIGKQNALPILLDGLKALEYRGYDSAGVAIINQNGSIFFEKCVGRVSGLENKLENNVNLEFPASIGIAHTRWATHGEPTEINAHPHSDCQKNIWLVHNGIIENYKELKNQLIKSGHKFTSETDTEVIAHLIEDFKKKKLLKIEEAVRQALRKIRGTYGLVILDKEEPEKLIAARNFSPLLLGIGADEYVVASDASAVLKYTNQIIYLSDGEIAILTPESYRIITLKNQSVIKKSQKIKLTLEKTQKNNYPHFMLKEIFEQPKATENSIRGRLIIKDGLAKLSGLENIEKELRKAKRILISACGTAYLAGKVGEYMLEEYAGIPTEVDLASEFRYRKPIFQKGDVFLAISQSGETADTLAALREAKQKDILTLGIVNVVGSTIAREIKAGVYQHIGPEIGVASTKAFTSQLTILALLTLFFGRQREMSLVTGRRIAQEINKLPELIKHTLKQEKQIKKIAKKYQNYKNFLYLGRKYNLPIALEGALKLKEISYIHAEGYGAGEMKHGPIAMIDENFPSLFLAPSDSVYEKVISNIQEIKARRGPIIVVTTEDNEEIKQLANDVIYIPKTLEMLTPILTAIPLQLFAYHTGVLQGCDVDKPRNLAKSVTVE